MKKDFLQSMCSIMNEKVFSEFFENYFNDWDDIIASIMLMKAYQAMCKKYTELNSDERLEYIRNLMKNSDNFINDSLRKFLVTLYRPACDVRRQHHIL